MQREPSVNFRRAVRLVLFLIAAAAMWLVLEYSGPRSDWLRVEAPARAVVGRPFALRVHLAPQPEPGFLYADLHWGTSRDKPMQYLGTGGPRTVSKAGGTYEYQVMVPPREGMRFVMGVIFWCRTGGWGKHKLAASTRLIPVITADTATATAPLEPLALQPPSDRFPDFPRPAALPRWLTGGLFLIAMIAGWRGSPSSPAPEWPTRRRRLFWQTVVLVLAVACLWELFGLDRWLGSRARSVARAEDLYYPRAAFQKIVISAAVAATILALLLVRRAPARLRLLLAALAVYAAIAVVNLMSLHTLDRVANLSWHGLTLVQALKLGCAGLVVIGMIKAAGRQDAPALIQR